MAFGAIEKSGFQMSQDAVESKGTAEYPRFVKPQRVAFVQSAWHRDVVAECREAFLAEIEARHIARGSIDVFEVPGSFEIPLHVQLLAKTRRYTAIVAAGLVSRLVESQMLDPVYLLWIMALILRNVSLLLITRR